MTKQCMCGPQRLHIPANICCFVNYNKTSSRELMWREVLPSLLEMDT